MSAPELLPGPEKGECGCGCGAFGRVKKNGHVAHACKCKRCMAPRYKSRGTRDERKIAKDLGGDRQPLSGALNGADVLYPGGCVEVTREKRVCGPVRTAWNKKAARIMTRRHQYNERGALICSDEEPWLVVTPYEDFLGERTAGMS